MELAHRRLGHRKFSSSQDDSNALLRPVVSHRVGCAYLMLVAALPYRASWIFTPTLIDLTCYPGFCISASLRFATRDLRWLLWSRMQMPSPPANYQDQGSVMEAFSSTAIGPSMKNKDAASSRKRIQSISNEQ